MKYQFDVVGQSHPVETFNFAGGQEARARRYGAERAFLWPHCLRGSADRLPKYVLGAIETAGFVAVCVGGTTFSHSVIALVRPEIWAKRFDD